MGTIPIVISLDILHYLQIRKGMSVDSIANAFGTNPEFIKKVLKKKDTLTSEQLDIYLKKENKHFWEFAIEAIPSQHLPEKVNKNILLCRDLSENIKKRRK